MLMLQNPQLESLLQMLTNQKKQQEFHHIKWEQLFIHKIGLLLKIQLDQKTAMMKMHGSMSYQIAANLKSLN